MTFPKQNFTIIDPGLGVAQPVDDIPIITGKAFGGSAPLNTLISIAQPSDVRASLGYGPLAEDVALALQQNGGPVYCMIHSDSTTPINVTMAGTPSITVAGVPRDNYALIVEITTGGVLGTGRFRYTLDAFDANAAPRTWSQIRTIPSGGGGAFVIPGTGLTITFAAGSYVLATQYTPPSPILVTDVATGDLATVAAAIEALASINFYLWAVSGSIATGTAGATLCAALGGHMAFLAGQFRFARALCDQGSGDTKANALTAAGTWTDARVVGCYGFELVTSVIPFEGFSTRRVSCVSSIAVRAFKALISTDLSRFADGALSQVRKIEFDSTTDQTLDAAKIATLRTWVGQPGFYITNAPLKSGFGSDFTDLQKGRCMDVACRTTYGGQLPYTSASLRTIDTGAIDPRDAAQIESKVQAQLDAALTAPTNASGNPGHVSAVHYQVDRNWNLQQTDSLHTTVGIRPLGYSKVINTDMFYTLTP